MYAATISAVKHALPVQKIVESAPLAVQTEAQVAEAQEGVAEAEEALTEGRMSQKRKPFASQTGNVQIGSTV